MRSRQGTMLSRAELLSTGADGKPFKKVDRHAIGYGVMPVKETPRHALSNPCDDSEAYVASEGRAERLMATLTSEERAVRKLQALRWREEREITVPVEELQERLSDGWMLVRQEAGQAVIAADVQEHLSYEEIGLRLGLTVHQVHRRVKSANRKLRGA